MNTLVILPVIGALLVLGTFLYKKRAASTAGAIDEEIELSADISKGPPPGSIIPLEDPYKMPRQQRSDVVKADIIRTGEDALTDNEDEPASTRPQSRPGYPNYSHSGV